VHGFCQPDVALLHPFVFVRPNLPASKKNTPSCPVLLSFFYLGGQIPPDLCTGSPPFLMVFFFPVFRLGRPFSAPPLKAVPWACQNRLLSLLNGGGPGCLSLALFEGYLIFQNPFSLTSFYFVGELGNFLFHPPSIGGAPGRGCYRVFWFPTTVVYSLAVLPLAFFPIGGLVPSVLCPLFHFSPVFFFLTSVFLGAGLFLGAAVVLFL